MKKTTPIKKRSTRRHATINYNEEAKMDKIFKKPTPQKHRGGYEEGSDSGDTPFGNSVEDASKDFGRMTGNFTIQNQNIYNLVYSALIYKPHCS